MPSIVTVVGVSGVGKTWALTELAKRRPFQHLSAGGLIRDARELAKTANALDALREANIDENQRMLILGFRNAIDASASHIVLDGHTIIETPSGVVTIDSDVFGQLGITEMIFVEDSADAIAHRRAADMSRKRPLASAAQISDYQEIARRQAHRICQRLNIPLNAINPADTRKLERLLFGVLPHE
jgi:adenylate kinase